MAEQGLVDLTGSSTDADALAALGAVDELDFPPGSSWEYSNSNYFLLGQVVLVASGSPLDEFLAAEVFEPLGLAMVMDPVAALPGKAGFVTTFVVVPEQRLALAATCTSPDSLEATGVTSEDELLEPWLRDA